jgi:hypothetical protein
MFAQVLVVLVRRIAAVAVAAVVASPHARPTPLHVPVVVQSFCRAQTQHRHGVLKRLQRAERQARSVRLLVTAVSTTAGTAVNTTAGTSVDTTADTAVNTTSATSSSTNAACKRAGGRR